MLSTALLLTLSASLHAQLYTYTNDLGGAPSGIATNASGTNLARVNGTESTEACPDGFNSNRWAKAGFYTNNRPSVEFTITPDAGYELNVTSVSADIRINAKGPLLWRFAYSTDGGASWTNNGSDIAVASSFCEVSSTLTWDIPDFTATGTVWVRMVGFDAYSNLNGKAVIRNVVLDGTVAETDADGDGFGVLVDCNDANPTINPDAAELCNGIDENCNGDIDEGLTFETWYADADGDTYGDAAMSVTTCDGAPAGYVADNTDCNDADAGVNPGAAEICNGLDENCNGDIDEGLTFETWYADADGDGYGDAAMSVTTCDGAPAGYVADNTDCNDADGAINPGAAEVCNGIDDNCNGDIDEGLTFETWYADADGDSYGDADMTVTTCDGAPAGYVADNTDCNDADASINPGAAEVCNGVDDNCDGNVDEGVLITFYVDADGDGYGDAAMSTEACEAPAGYVADNTDCNDADATVNPGATEVCGNGVDENCDGVIDDADVTASFDIVGAVPACANEGTFFQSTATGAGITYQWIRNGIALAGATDATYTPLNTGYYQLEVTNGICTAISDTTYAIIKKIPDADAFAPLGTDICVYGYAKVKCVSNPGTGATYQWYLNGDIIPGATANVYETTEAGDYYAVVTGPNGCTNTSATITLTADCRQGDMLGTLSLYPNPTGGNFTLALSGSAFSGEAMVQITDLTGRVVYTNNAVIADGEMNVQISKAQELVSGVYLVLVSAGEFTWNTRVVIAH